MSKTQRVKHEFVEFIPQELEPEKVYISGTYATCSHLCLCGCGNKVVTPLAPDEWALTFDGETISFDHSFGNWSFDCQSHYWIERSRVIWARAWSKQKIEANRSRDRRQKQRRSGAVEADQSEITPTAVTGGWMRRTLRRVWPGDHN